PQYGSIAGQVASPDDIAWQCDRLRRGSAAALLLCAGLVTLAWARQLALRGMGAASARCAVRLFRPADTAGIVLAGALLPVVGGWLAAGWLADYRWSPEVWSGVSAVVLVAAGLAALVGRVITRQAGFLVLGSRAGHYKLVWVPAAMVLAAMLL